MRDRAEEQSCTRASGSSLDATCRDSVGIDSLSVERRFQLLAELTGQIAYDHDLASGSVSWNGAITRLTGYTAEEFQAFDSKAWQSLIHPDDRLPRNRAIEAARHDLRPYYLLYRLRRKDGVYTNVEERGMFLPEDSRHVERAIGSIMDVSERREMEQQLVQAQKMESIGRLASGVAHDFNNIINIIIGYAEWELRRYAPETEAAQSLQQILNAAERAATLTRQLLAFARKEKVCPYTVSLNRLINEVESMLRRLLGEDVALKIELETELENVFVDPGQIHQVLMNLVANARDAMPDGGTLTIRTANAAIKIDEQHPDAQRHVSLSVSDTGQGMSPEVMGRVFEPFYTTKTEGTGLGLSAVHGIAQQCGAVIRVDSAKGMGTTFSLYFPPATMENVLKEACLERVTAGGCETILLVEDEIGVLGIMKEGLEHRGYTVLAAADGEAAIDLARSHAGAIDLLLTDVIMPGMSGHALARRIVAERPSLRVLYISGYTADFIARKNLCVEEMELLFKPFSEEALQARIRAVLDEVDT